MKKYRTVKGFRSIVHSLKSGESITCNYNGLEVYMSVSHGSGDAELTVSILGGVSNYGVAHRYKFVSDFTAQNIAACIKMGADSNTWLPGLFKMPLKRKAFRIQK